MAKPKEMELKFESVGNTQLKFTPIEKAEIVTKKLAALCNFLNIQIGQPKRIEIEDDYYDDVCWKLKNNGCTFRLRIINGEHFVTLKSAQGLTSDGALMRNEYEFHLAKDEFNKLLNNSSKISGMFKNKMGINIQVGNLKSGLIVKNHRTAIPLFTDVSEYTFCYDKYYFYDPETGKYSEIFAEIEIELIGQNKQEDSKLKNLKEAILVLFNYTPNDKSKLERGFDYLKDEKIQTVYTVGIDIVEYSIRPADIQKQLIQKLTYYIKKAISETHKGGKDPNIIFIPTGDGMFLIFENRPETVIPIVLNVQNLIKAYNKNCSFQFHFEFRTGLHSGPVFKFTDINDSPNFAGNGINIAQRVMSVGDKWHILASREGFESMGNINWEYRSHFSSLGEYPIKHGPKIEIFNFYDSILQFGNPMIPVK